MQSNDHKSGSMQNIKSQAQSIDLFMAMKSVYAISKEIHFESALTKMLLIMTENAGAQKCAYIVKDKDKLLIETRFEVGQSRPVLHKENISKEVDGIPVVSAQVVKLVESTNKDLIINDASNDKLLSSDKYILKTKPKSILCFPIVVQGATSGIFYFENNLASGVFNSDKLAVLKLLSAHVGITLENARLYEHLEEKVAERTKELKKALEKVELLSITDNLTKIYNRRKFDVLINLEIERAKRYGRPFSIIMFDIDNFKKFNDSYGHKIGDKVLCDMANLVGKNIRKNDYFFRWGGEEFIILACETKLNDAAILAEKIRILIAEHDFNELGTITISLGVTEFNSSDSADDIVIRADDLLYRAKENGRNKVACS